MREFEDRETRRVSYSAAAFPVLDLILPHFGITSWESSVQTPLQVRHITNLSGRLAARL